MNEKLIEHKIQKATELICHLYFQELITDAYISGSVAKGTARKESDIDIFIINPLFEFAFDDLAPSNYEIEDYDDPSKLKLIYEDAPNIKLVADYLQDIGAEFKILTKTKKIPLSERDEDDEEETSSFWHQLYDGEIFHIMPWPSSDTVTYPDIASINISMDICLQLLED